MDSNSIFTPWLIWFLLGIGLAFLELVLPGFIVLFFGIGCLVVSGALLIWPLTITQQIVIFILSSIGSIVILRKFMMKVFLGKSSDKAADEFDDFPKGMKVKVVQKITPNSRGRVFYRGTQWDATSDEEINEDEVVEILRYADNSNLVFFVKKI